MNQDHLTATLRAHLFGSCAIVFADRAIDLTRRQTRTLFEHLVAELEPLARDHLTLLFWPDPPNTVARHKLTKILTHLRRALPWPALILVMGRDVYLDAAAVIELCGLSPPLKSLLIRLLSFKERAAAAGEMLVAAGAQSVDSDLIEPTGKGVFAQQFFQVRNERRPNNDAPYVKFMLIC